MITIKTETLEGKKESMFFQKLLFLGCSYSLNITLIISFAVDFILLSNLCPAHRSIRHSLIRSWHPTYSAKRVA
jgi:hypothetical protein